MRWRRSKKALSQARHPCSLSKTAANVQQLLICWLRVIDISTAAYLPPPPVPHLLRQERSSILFEPFPHPFPAVSSTIGTHQKLAPAVYCSVSILGRRDYVLSLELIVEIEMLTD